MLHREDLSLLPSNTQRARPVRTASRGQLSRQIPGPAGHIPELLNKPESSERAVYRFTTLS